MKTNEFGIRLDRNGYAPSILERAEAPCCAICGRSWGAKLDRHEPWGGVMNRDKSKSLGLWVSLCHFGCHEGPGSVHDDPALNRELRRRVQNQAMCVYGWDLDEWRRRFGKSEIAEGEDVYAVEEREIKKPGASPSSAACGRHLPPLGEGKESNAWGSERTAESRPYGAGAVRSSGFAVLVDGPELPF
jgi:hypothetical protein